jgi:hypothetical protein
VYLPGSASRFIPSILDLDRHMHVLHEEVIARIAAIPDNTARLAAKMARALPT